MTMPARSYSAQSTYRYGFNGKEKDKDLGEGVQDYGMRIYDNRLGKFLSVDPLTKAYPHYTPYSYAGNKPIRFIDLDGKEEFDPFQKIKDYAKTVLQLLSEFKFNKAAVAHGAADGILGNSVVGLFSSLSNDLLDFFWDDLSAESQSHDLFDNINQYNSFNDQASYAYGRIMGDLVTILGAEGIKEAGIGMMAGGTAGTIFSLGTAGEITVPVAIGGIAVTAAGATIQLFAYSDLTATTLVFMSKLKQAADENLNTPEKPKSTGTTEPPAKKNPYMGGTQTPSKTVWKGEGKERLDVENPNPGQRPGQIHYQDKQNKKYLYDPESKSFPGAPKKVNKLLENEDFQKGIDKGMKYFE